MNIYTENLILVRIVLLRNMFRTDLRYPLLRVCLYVASCK
jgi:hypothetical protein